MQKQGLSLRFAFEGDLVHGAWILSVYLRKVAHEMRETGNTRERV